MLKALLPTAIAAILAAGPGHAHPHIFVETGLRLIHDSQGRLAEIEVTWIYDELFSLLLLEDRELDADFDGVLTPEENEKLQGFDMDWPDDFLGDLYVTANGKELGLGAPIPGAAHLDDKGRLIGVHRRPLLAPVDSKAEDVVVKAYDPTYYTAYTLLVEQISTDAADCAVEVFAPDLDEAYAQLAEALDELMGATDFNQEMDFPAIGDRFAEEVRLTCQGGS